MKTNYQPTKPSGQPIAPSCQSAAPSCQSAAPNCQLVKSGISCPELLLFLPFLLAFPLLADNTLVFGTPIYPLFVRIFAFILVLQFILQRLKLSGFWLLPVIFLFLFHFPWPAGVAIYVVLLQAPVFHQLSSGEYSLKIAFLLGGVLLYIGSQVLGLNLIVPLVFLYLFFLSFVYGNSCRCFLWRLFPILPAFGLFYFSGQINLLHNRPECHTRLFQDLQKLFAPQTVLLRSPSPGFMRHLDQLPTDSLLFPLPEPPAFVRADGFRMSNFWLSLHAELQKNYPAFYVFTDAHGAYFLGFRNWDDLLLSLKESRLMPWGSSNNIIQSFSAPALRSVSDETSLGIAAVLLSQAFSYQEMTVITSNILVAPERYSPLLSRGGKALPLERYHKFFPLLLARKIFSSESQTELFLRAENVERSIKYFLSEDWFEHCANLLFFLRQRQLISPLFIEYWQAELELAMDSPISALRRAEVLLMEKPDEMLYQVLRFRAMQKREKSFVSYGPNFDFESMTKISKELYEKTGDMNWLKQHFSYGRKMMAPPPEQAFGSGCGDNSLSGCSGGDCGSSSGLSVSVGACN